MLKIDDTVLVIIDVQGKLATLMHRKDEFFANLVKMVRGAKVLEIPILWNEQLPDKLGPTIPELKEVLADTPLYVKKTFSCCGLDSFNAALTKQGRKQILLMGMETHICVYQSAIDLLRLGHEVHVIADCVSSRIPHNIQIGLDAMKDAGAKITSLEMALFDLMQVAEGDKFRQIVKIIK